jgi:Cu+-exporting ATPase
MNNTSPPAGHTHSHTHDHSHSACAQHTGHGTAIAQPRADADLKDPVCGMTVTARSVHHSEHMGHSFFFCSPKCKTKFDANPMQYMGCPKCGMTLEPVMPSLEDDDNPELRDFQRRFWWTLPLTAIVFVLAMFGERWHLMNMRAQTWMEFVLGTPIVLWAGWPFFARGWQSLVQRSPNMWTLIGKPSRHPSFLWGAWPCILRPQPSSFR